MGRIEVDLQLLTGRLPSEGFVEQCISVELLCHGDEAVHAGTAVKLVREDKHMVSVQLFQQDVFRRVVAGKAAGVFWVDFCHPLGCVFDVNVITAIRHQQATAAAEHIVRHGTQHERGGTFPDAHILFIEHAGIMALHAPIADKEHGLSGFGKEEIVQLADILAVS